MVETTILQNWLVTKFILPFTLVFVIVFAILVKTKVLGDNKQVNAIVAFVIGLIFVGFAYPKDVVQNMILFLSVALIIVFVLLVLWGFLGGGEMKFDAQNSKLKFAALGVSIIAVVAASLWALGVHNQLIDTLFYKPWSNTFWTNAVFIVAIAGTLAIVLLGSKAKSG